MKPPPIDSVSGRKAWAFVVLFGAAIVFTAMIVWALWFLRAVPGFTFWLALAAHVQLAIVMTAFSWTLGRRAKIAVSRSGAEIDDREDAPAPAAQPGGASMTLPDQEIEKWD
jgi:hypothetical protein